MKTLTEEISLIFADKQHRLSALTIDAVVKESHELRAQITEHPAENGQAFCDHVSTMPITVQLEGIISNTPLTLIGVTAFTSLSNYLSDQSNDLAEQAYKKLEDIFAKHTPISISTSLKDYDNMVLESLSVERGGGTSASLHFRATAKQVRLVDQLTIAIDFLPEPKPERAKSKQRMGKQESKPASEEIAKKTAEKRSLLDTITNWGK